MKKEIVKLVIFFLTVLFLWVAVKYAGFQNTVMFVLSYFFAEFMGDKVWNLFK
jgi:hypothetical protein